MRLEIEYGGEYGSPKKRCLATDYLVGVLSDDGVRVAWPGGTRKALEAVQILRAALEQWADQEGLRKKAERECDDLRSQLELNKSAYKLLEECDDKLNRKLEYERSRADGNFHSYERIKDKYSGSVNVVKELKRRLEGVLETEKAWENRFLSLVGDRTPEGAGNAVITLKGRLEAHHKSMAVDATEECPCCHVLKWAES